MHLILASASPRRQELLKLFGIPFTVRVADIDETMNPGAAAYDEVGRLSREKALAVSREKDDIVIAADTIVVCEGRILGKPANPEAAFGMLSLLSGRDHQVMTGCTVIRGGTVHTFTEVTDLHFRNLTEKEIRRYVRSGEPMDKTGGRVWNTHNGHQPEWYGKAGGYAIQGMAAKFVTRIEGDFYNVVGLPVCRLWQELKKLGIDI